MKPPVQFTCGHCGEVVRFALWHGQQKPRNHCPACLWSQHVSIGAEAGYPPCGAMMRGVDVGNEEVTWRCLGCRFMMRGPADDYIFRTVTDALGSAAPLTLWGKPGSGGEEDLPGPGWQAGGGAARRPLQGLVPGGAVASWAVTRPAGRRADGSELAAAPPP